MSVKSFFIFSAIFLHTIGVNARAESSDGKLLAVAVHVHSNVSSGAKSIEQIASLAKRQGIDSVIFTDQLSEHYEYGLPPVRSILKTSFSRPSISSLGSKHYLDLIQSAQEKHPEVLLIAGASATPFFYWSGSLFPGPLVLNNRAADLLVLGLQNPNDYERLPVLGRKNSPFNAYSGDQFSRPYQLFIDQTLKQGGLVYWSHPLAAEHLILKEFKFGRDVQLDTPSSANLVQSTFHYTGLGIPAVELAQINAPRSNTTAAPGGLWDEILTQYCAGERNNPAWIIGEIDYNGYPRGIHTLDSILNMVSVSSKTTPDVLDSLRKGRSYAIIPGPSRRLEIEKFAAVDTISGTAVESGGTLPLSKIGTPEIYFSGHFSDRTPGSKLKILLIKNGLVLQIWEETAPFHIIYRDTENTQAGKSYYRFIVTSEDSSDKLLTNPIFTERS